MTTLADYLNANGVSSDTIVQSAWNLAFATVGFPSEEDIPDLFRKLLPHPDEIATDIETLTRDPRLMLAAALEVLSLGWDRDQATVISHIEECQAALVSFPKIATVGGVLVVAGWVLLSKGVTHHETHTMVRPDGGYEQIEKTDRGPFGLKIRATGEEFEIFVGSVGGQSQSAETPKTKSDEGKTTIGSGKLPKSPAKPAIHVAQSKGKSVSTKKMPAADVCAPTSSRASPKRGRPSKPS